MKAMTEKRFGGLGVSGSTKNAPQALPQAPPTLAAEVVTDHQLPTTPTAPNTPDSVISQVLQTMPSEEQRRVIEGLIASTPPTKEAPTAEIPIAIESRHELPPEVPMSLLSSAGPSASAQPTPFKESTQKPPAAVAPLIALPDQSAQKPTETFSPSIAPHNDGTQASDKPSLEKIQKKSIKAGKSDTSKEDRKAKEAN